MLTIDTLIAFTAFFLTAKAPPVLPVLSLLLLGTHVTTVRFDKPTLAAWILRLVVFASIAAINKGRPSGGADWLFEGRTISIIGQILAAELVIQQWARPVTQPPHGVIVLLSGLVFMAACNTFDERYIHVFTPVYMLFTALALRDIHRRSLGRSTPGATGERIFAPFRVRHWAAILLALAIGASLHFGIRSYRADITMLGIQLLRGRQLPQSVGMTTQPNLSATFEAQDSPERVLRLENYSGDNHLRSMSFDVYGGGRWGPIMEQRRSTPLIATTPEKHDKANSSKNHRATVSRLVDAHGFIFAPLDADGIIAPDDLDWDADFGGPVRGPELSPYEYELVTTDEEFYQGPLCVPLSDEQRERLLQVPPEIDARVRALAQKIGGHLPEQHERIYAVMEYLMANHKYSRKTQRGRGDPVSNFLLQKRAAHCEYFASAAVILLRLLDVPTRYVTGYYAHEQAGPNTLIVRQRDAHAWAESWIDGFGWVTVEATPASGQPDALSQKLPPWQKAWEWIQDRATELRENGLNRKYLLVFAGVLAIGGLGRVWLARRRKVEATGGFRYSSPDAELRALTVRFEQLMQRHNLTCPENRTWQEYITMVAAESETAPVDFTTARVFLEEYNTVRFGKPNDRVAIAHLSTTLQQLEADISRVAKENHNHVNHNY